MPSAWVQLLKINKNPSFRVEGTALGGLNPPPRVHSIANDRYTIHINHCIGGYSDFACSKKGLVGCVFRDKNIFGGSFGWYPKLSIQVWATESTRGTSQQFSPHFSGWEIPSKRYFWHLFDLQMKAVKTPKGFFAFLLSHQCCKNPRRSTKKRWVFFLNDLFCLEKIISIIGKNLETRFE